MLKDDSQEGQLECAHFLYKDSSYAGGDIGNYKQLKREYLPYNGRDPASRLTQIADKRREQVTPEKTDEEKAGKIEKAEERYRSTRSAQPANGRDENLSA